MNALSPALGRTMVREIRRRSLYACHLLAFEILNGFPLKEAPFLEAVCHRFEEMLRGNTSQLINTMPPRHGKTEMTVSLMAFGLGHDPTLKFMTVSYGMELSTENLDKVRTIMNDPRYRLIFPHARIRSGKSRAHHFKTTAGGEVRAVSTGGVVTGFGTHFLIIDDLLKADEALTVAGREAAIRFYKNSLLSRFNDPATARILIVGQRLHEDDIVGHVLGLGVKWDHINLPAIAEYDELVPLGRGRVWQRRKGDVLHPEHMPRWALNERRLELGDRFFGAQFQQNPTISDNCPIDLGWFGQYDERPPRTFFHRIIQTLDPAISDGPRSDYSAGQTWGYHDGKWYLLDVIRVKLRFHELKQRVIAWHREWKADALIIEGGSIGDALWEEVKQARLPGIVVAPRPRLSKVERLTGRTALLAEGDFLLPQQAPWLADLRHELVSFPDGRHDDQVDAMTQFLEFVSSRREWVKARYDGDGRRIRGRRPERQSRYYEGSAPSQSSWA